MAAFPTTFKIYSLGPYLRLDETTWCRCQLDKDGKTCTVFKDGGQLGHTLIPSDKIRYTIGWQNSLEPPKRGYSPASALHLGVLESTHDAVKEQARMWEHPVYEWQPFDFIPETGLGKLVMAQGWEYGQTDANKCFLKLDEMLTAALGVRP